MSDWSRLGKHVLARRVNLGYKKREDFASAVGVSSRVIGDIEVGRRGNFDAVTIASMERVLRWETGSAERVAAGGEAKLLEPAPEQPRPRGVDPRADPRVSEEIERIYESKMSARERLRAIQIVLALHAEAQAETATVTAQAFDATVVTSEQDSSDAR